MNKLVTIANRSKLITHTGFKNYDVCLNTYVGCEFGCSYCYVRFFIKDKDKQWGEFVRIRDHVKDKLPTELNKGYVTVPTAARRPVLDKEGKPSGKTKRIEASIPIQDARLVIGTMTDPYQPVEKKYRVTRNALEILANHSNKFQKIGIFTRSPLVLQDLDLIKQLPQARVHFTITPYPHNVMRKLEPYSPLTETRWKIIAKLKEAGIRVHVNVAPIMPTLSEDNIEQWVKKLTELQVDEYFVDPMQPYDESFKAFKESCQGLEGVNWQKIEETMLNKETYLEWKFDYFQKWDTSRRKYQHLAPKQLPIWSDHENHVWVNMKTGEQMSLKNYDHNS